MLGAPAVSQGCFQMPLLPASRKGLSATLHARRLVSPGESEQLERAPQHENNNG